VQPGNFDKGWALATYKNTNLGWLKVLQNRINNYYPVEWRILKEFTE
jgi:NOL1/NOP2/fmu family ribosome biogenesis protein